MSIRTKRPVPIDGARRNIHHVLQYGGRGRRMGKGLARLGLRRR